MRYLLVLLLLSGCVWGSTPSADPTLDSDVTVIATGLSVPWELAFLPSGEILVTERVGRLTLLPNTTIATFEVDQRGEGGLLGMALHPEFESNNYLYLYETEGRNNRVVRYQYVDEELLDRTVLIDDIPGALYHDGGRIAFGPDGLLYVTIGDATEASLAQDESTLHGTLIRMEDDGSSVEVVSYGHRNAQGLVWVDGDLYSTEHGRSGLQSGMDELNRIVEGGNYGWPLVEGDEVMDGMIAPLVHSGASVTWAPASLTYLDGVFYFGGLRGEAVYSYELGSDSVERVLEGYGRIRTVVAHNNSLYVTTSNTDGRGRAAADDDKILRVFV